MKLHLMPYYINNPFRIKLIRKLEVLVSELEKSDIRNICNYGKNGLCIFRTKTSFMDYTLECKLSEWSEHLFSN